MYAVPENHFEKDQAEFIPVSNGMLRLSDRALLPFSPSYRCRHKLAVAYDEKAYCPRFLDILLKPALDAGDIFLIQRYFGLALLGVNLSQKILLLTGTAGGGKSTLVSVLTGIIGNENVGQLRTDQLGERFEIGRLSAALTEDLSEVEQVHIILEDEIGEPVHRQSSGVQLTQERMTVNRAPNSLRATS